MRGIEVAIGRPLPASDIDRGSNIALLGSDTAKNLFGEANPVGQLIRIGDWRMRVIGVTKARGTQLGMNLDELAIVPVATGMRMFNRSSLFRIMIQLRPRSDIEAVEKKIEAVILERHDEIDVTCVTPDSVIDSLSSVLSTLTLALVGIAAISLCVAGIGIMNVMLVTVSERRSEIGLLKALGATRRQVMLVFLTESILLSSAGGLLGIGIGTSLIQIITWMFPAVPATAPVWALFSALVVALFTGVFFGVFPAMRAMRLDPIVALSSRA